MIALSFGNHGYPGFGGVSSSFAPSLDPAFHDGLNSWLNWTQVVSYIQALRAADVENAHDAIDGRSTAYRFARQIVKAPSKRLVGETVIGLRGGRLNAVTRLRGSGVTPESRPLQRLDGSILADGSIDPLGQVIVAGLRSLCIARRLYVVRQAKLDSIPRTCPAHLGDVQDRTTMLDGHDAARCSKVVMIDARGRQFIPILASDPGYCSRTGPAKKGRYEHGIQPKLL